MKREDWLAHKASNNVSHQGTFTPVPRKYSSALHKKFAKLERQFESPDLEDKPVRANRLLRSAKATLSKIEKVTKPLV